MSYKDAPPQSMTLKKYIGDKILTMKLITYANAHWFETKWCNKWLTLTKFSRVIEDIKNDTNWKLKDYWKMIKWYNFSVLDTSNINIRTHNNYRQKHWDHMCIITCHNSIRYIGTLIMHTFHG